MSRPSIVSLELEDLPDTHTATETYICHLEAENERLRGLIKTYRNMVRYDWIAQQDKKIKELQTENEALRATNERNQWELIREKQYRGTITSVVRGEGE